MELLSKAKKNWYKLKLKKQFLKEAVSFLIKQCKYNASIDTEEDKVKYQYVILRLNHTIEKGQSMRNPKRGYGQKKVLHILDVLEDYFNRYGTDDGFLVYPLSTIKEYIGYTLNTGVEIPYIEERFKILCDKCKIHTFIKNSGTYVLARQQVEEKCKGDFSSLLYSRHSIRYFKPMTVSQDILDKALTLAQRTPSACNRQGWKTHIYFNEKSIELIKWQTGARGFESEIRTSIVVTANLKAFLSYEVFQAYVDGGLYAMNLINSLHSLGIGTIPLSLGFTCQKLSTIHQFDIPQDEVPILIIGCGYMEDTFKVAASDRKNIKLTNTYHD